MHDFDFPYSGDDYGSRAMTFEKPSIFRRMIDKLTGSERGLFRAHAHVSETALAVRQVGEGVVVGAALGAAQSKLPGGLDFHGIPLDAALGGIGVAAGVALADQEYAHDLRNIGTAGATIFAFRKMGDLIAAKTATAKVAGESRSDIGAQDPIIGLANKF